MILRGLLFVVLVACVTSVPKNSAQSNSSGTAASSGPMQQTTDLLLKRESEALDNFQQVLAPAIRCDSATGDFRQTCETMVMRLQDDAQQATQHIALYRTSHTPADLFDVYVHLQSLLTDIEIFSVEDDYNGGRNHLALVSAFNSFIKLTGVWFMGEMKETIGSCTR